MNKKTFFEELDKYLIGISKEDKDEILEDYKEHFIIGKRKKRTEAQIAKSLGNPKKIARDIRRELSPSEQYDFKSEAIETFAEVKTFSKHLFNEVRNKVDSLLQSNNYDKPHNKLSTFIVSVLLIITIIMFFRLPFLFFLSVVMLGYIIYTHNKNSTSENKTNKTTTNKSNKKITPEKKKNHQVRLIISIAFNFLFFIWFWLELALIIFALLLSGFAILIAAALIMSIMIFAIIKYNNHVISDILFSGLFSGMGLIILGALIMNLSTWCFKQFFKATKIYIDMNKKFIEL